MGIREGKFHCCQLGVESAHGPGSCIIIELISYRRIRGTHRGPATPNRAASLVQIYSDASLSALAGVSTVSPAAYKKPISSFWNTLVMRTKPSGNTYRSAQTTKAKTEKKVEKRR